ncbi:MAG: molybdenum cofactor guanylyltransferase MobA [gamma proteobacterium symbiont of Stewartia floridana]|nr:molybdenum cofactor guanylyltransferase [Candidatus Thiodiazotropha taylori]RLW52719.1 MAG: molybdenum cofactor guanylyltransferase MobA [gamma proteobacterium symbiont of Stewartia floridana]MCG7894903.1 molybdenum cofactor guanylyltransferase [Candidatus Thiodiazotropha taylori]MCG7907541.1 molybdenum cofactor guanylyltransferase [Candidatus Thiodiazotropha taylori]MCG7910326.1 molybdenum cofactor guanylyltransferase [Candidatus Thiodiazotropha taylori]
MNDRSDYTAVILAGGRGSRMGGNDKGLILFDGKPLIEHVINTIAPQVGRLLINANRNMVEYQRFGYPVIRDELSGYQGPLAGIYSALEQITTPNLITVPCDGPRLPKDLVARLVSARETAAADIVVAHDGKRLQPVYALISKKLRPSLKDYLDGGDRKIDLWYAQHKMVTADFSDIPETFLNINTPEERNELEQPQTAEH